MAARLVRGAMLEHRRRRASPPRRGRAARGRRRGPASLRPSAGAPGGCDGRGGRRAKPGLLEPRYGNGPGACVWEVCGFAFEVELLPCLNYVRAKP